MNPSKISVYRPESRPLVIGVGISPQIKGAKVAVVRRRNDSSCERIQRGHQSRIGCGRIWRAERNRNQARFIRRRRSLLDIRDGKRSRGDGRSVVDVVARHIQVVVRSGYEAQLIRSCHSLDRSRNTSIRSHLLLDQRSCGSCGSQRDARIDRSCEPDRIGDRRTQHEGRRGKSKLCLDDAVGVVTNRTRRTDKDRTRTHVNFLVAIRGASEGIHEILGRHQVSCVNHIRPRDTRVPIQRQILPKSRAAGDVGPILEQNGSRGSRELESGSRGSRRSNSTRGLHVNVVDLLTRSQTSPRLELAVGRRLRRIQRH